MKRAIFAMICLSLLAGNLCLAADNQASPSWWGRAPGDKPIVNGIVENVSAANIAVKTPQGVKAFRVDPKTMVTVAGARATIADVVTGMPVTVHFKLVNNNVPIAIRIAVPKPRYKGEITAINGGAIVLKSKEGEFRVIVTEATKIRSHGYEGTLADLRVGYVAGAQGAITDNVMTADFIEFIPAVAKGAVTAINGNAITVKTIRQLSVTVVATEKTVVMVRPRVGPNVRGTLADVKVGSPVNVGYATSEDAAPQLLWVDVMTGL